MALNKDVLGTALYNKAQNYNNINSENIEQTRLDFWKAIAEEIIKHIQSSATLTVPGLGLIAPQFGGPVTGTSITGTIQ
jgi:hypothetical protein